MKRSDEDSFSGELVIPPRGPKPPKGSRAQARLGLRAVDSTYTNESTVDFVLVAIHGSGGDAEYSWTNRETEWCWISDISEFTNRNVRTYTYGYDSTSKFSPAQHADWLLDAMIQQNLHPRPMIFLAKDFGGLILSQVQSPITLDWNGSCSY